MRGFFAALTMLTVFPLPFFRVGEKDLERAAVYFPVVALLYGAALYGAARLLGLFLPPAAVSALVVAAAQLGCKMLHLDGAADTADAFFSSRDRARKLEIMRDSRIGTMGVFAIVALLLLQFAFLLGAPDAVRRAAMAGVMGCCGRAAVVPYICFSQYARPEGGMGAIWFRRKPFAGIPLAIAVWCVMERLPGVSVAAAVLGAAITLILPGVWSAVTRKVIGGATGDTIGACEEICATAALFGTLCLFSFCK